MFAINRRRAIHALCALFAALAVAAIAACSSSNDEPTPPPAQQPDQQIEQAQPQPAPAQLDQLDSQTQEEPQEEPPAEQDAEEDAQQSTASSAADQQTSQPEPQADAAQQTAQQQTTQQATQQSTQPAEPDPLEGVRAVVLFGDLTETVFALGAGHIVVGRDATSIYPPEAELLPNLGFDQELSAEGVLSLEPTIVIGSPSAGPPEVLEQIRSAGVEVLIVPDLYTFEAPAMKIRAIGAALGLEQRAEELVADVEARIDAVFREVAERYAETQRRPSVLFLYVRRNAPQLVAGEDSPAASMIEAAGGTDAGTQAGIYGFAPLTPEAIVAADPEALLVMQRAIDSIGGIDGLLEVPGVAETRAGRARRVIAMDDLYLLGFGPRLPEALRDLAAEIHRLMEE